MKRQRSEGTPIDISHSTAIAESSHSLQFRRVPVSSLTRVCILWWKPASAGQAPSTASPKPSSLPSPSTSITPSSGKSFISQAQFVTLSRSAQISHVLKIGQLCTSGQPSLSADDGLLPLDSQSALGATFLDRPQIATTAELNIIPHRSASRSTTTYRAASIASGDPYQVATWPPYAMVAQSTGLVSELLPMTRLSGGMGYFDGTQPSYRYWYRQLLFPPPALIDLPSSVHAEGRRILQHYKQQQEPGRALDGTCYDVAVVAEGLKTIEPLWMPADSACSDELPQCPSNISKLMNGQQFAAAMPTKSASGHLPRPSATVFEVRFSVSILLYYLPAGGEGGMSPLVGPPQELLPEATVLKRLPSTSDVLQRASHPQALLFGTGPASSDVSEQAKRSVSPQCRRPCVPDKPRNDLKSYIVPQRDADNDPP